VLWLHVAALASASVTPVDAASDSIVGYVLGFGPLGIIALALGWLLFRGWRLISPAGEAAMRDAARTESRADLVAERDRLLAEKQQAENQRDEAMQVARDQLTPLLISFTSSTQALLPLLQNLVGQGAADKARRQGPRQ